MPTSAREPKMFCLRCGYALDYLPGAQCPECGMTFDTQNPATYRGPRRPAPVAKLLAAYLIPLFFGFLFWTVIGAAKWRRSGTWPPLSRRLLAALIQSAGPVAWLPLGVNPWVPWVMAMVSPLLWVIWLLVVARTPLSRLPIVVHVIFALLWNFSGCLRVSVSV